MRIVRSASIPAVFSRARNLRTCRSCNHRSSSWSSMRPDCQNARPHRAADAACGRRRGHRVDATLLVALLHLLTAAHGRYCCKSPKLPGDNFPAVRRSEQRAPIRMASVTLPRSPVSFSSGDEVPRIFTRKPLLQPGEFLISSAKRLLQQYRHEPAAPTRTTNVR